MKNYKNLPLFLILALGACRSTSSEWSCRNLDSKVGCVNISKADDAYLENAQEGDSLGNSSGANSKSGNLNATQLPISKSAKYSSSTDDINVGQIKLIRSSEKIGRVWIAPYMDGKGNYHEGSFIRVVDEISRWEKIIADDKTSSVVPITTETSVTDSANNPKFISTKEIDIDWDDDEEVVSLNQKKPKLSKPTTLPKLPITDPVF